MKLPLQDHLSMRIAGIAAVPIAGSEASILAMDVIEQIGGVIGKLNEQK